VLGSERNYESGKSPFEMMFRRGKDPKALEEILTRGLFDLTGKAALVVAQRCNAGDAGD
jgi:hypothetical protein